MSQQPEWEAIVDSSLGQEFEKGECQALTTVMKVRSLSDGEVLVKEGDSDNTLFILTQGKLVVSSEVEGKPTAVYTMKVGECAGTRAFVDLAPRRATLTAEGNATVYTLEPRGFEGLLQLPPRFFYKVVCCMFSLTQLNLLLMNVQTPGLSHFLHQYVWRSAEGAFEKN